MLREIDRFGHGVYACVMDSFDYASALENIVPAIASKKLEKGGYLVLRPDSGDQVEVILMALRFVHIILLTLTLLLSLLVITYFPF